MGGFPRLFVHGGRLGLLVAGRASFGAGLGLLVAAGTSFGAGVAVVRGPGVARRAMAVGPAARVVSSLSLSSADAARTFAGGSVLSPVPLVAA